MKKEKTDNIGGYNTAINQYLFDVDCIIDCHTHMLPSIDDGARTEEISEELISHSLDKNINYVCLTPHFYPDQMRIEDFLEKRKKCYEGNKFKENTCLGAEVAYYSGIGNSKEIDKLALGKSKYILIEMPFQRWTYYMYNDICELIARGFRVIIAHFERYLEYRNLKYIKLLKANGCLIQSNSEYFINRKTSKKAIKMFDLGLIDILASDTHNLTTRKQTLPEALIILIQKTKENRIYNMLTKYETLVSDIFKK